MHSPTDTVDRTSLADLAVTANREHHAFEEGLEGALPHAIAAGEVLIAARQKCPHGRWRRWCQENLSMSLATVDRYMRLAHNREALELAGITSVSKARQLIQGLGGPVTRGGGQGLPESVKEEAARLRAAQLPRGAVAELLGVSAKTIERMEHPERGRHQETQRRTRNARKRREAAELDQQRRAKQAARKQGGAIAELYAASERMQDVLGRAHREASDPEARRALSLAGEYYRAMRDQIVKALGAST